MARVTYEEKTAVFRAIARSIAAVAPDRADSAFTYSECDSAALWDLLIQADQVHATIPGDALDVVERWIDDRSALAIPARADVAPLQRIVAKQRAARHR